MDFRIALWNKTNASLAMSHKEGLTKQDLEALRELKVGDRLTLFKNNSEDIHKPDYTLVKSQFKEKSDAIHTT